MLAAAFLAGTGCSKPVTCSPNGTALSVTAKNFGFGTDCLSVPANQAFSIAFDNKDKGAQHNVLISVAFNPGAKVLFKGDAVTGPRSVTYQVPGLAPGRYSFECSYHPGQMHGTFIVP